MDTPKIALITTSLMDLGIRSLKEVLKRKGINSELYFLSTDSVRYTNSELRQIIKALEKLNPEIIGVSTVKFSSVRSKQLIKIIKITEALKNKVLVVGGVHPTACPEEYINLVDIVLIGEGEEAFLELVEDVLNGRDYCNVKNLWVRKNGRVVKNEIRPLIEDINSLPFEEYSSGGNLLKNGKLVKLDKAIYRANFPLYRKESVFLFAARGCTRCCSYCVNSIFNKIYPRKIRKRDISQIIEYLEKLKRDNPALEFISLMEDNFLLRTGEEICKFSEKYKNRVGLPFFIYCTPDSVTERKLIPLVKAGLKILNMGIHSGSEKINKLIYNRDISTNKVLESTKIIAKYADKIEPIYDFIIDNPYETKQDILSTIELIKKIPKPFDLCKQFLLFYKGTSLYDKALADKVIDKVYCEVQRDYHTVRRPMKKNENERFYLYSVILCLEGTHTNNRYGLLTPKILDFLISGRSIKFFRRFPTLVFFLNKFLPTERRREYWKFKFLEVLNKYKVGKIIKRIKLGYKSGY